MTATPPAPHASDDCESCVAQSGSGLTDHAANGPLAGVGSEAALRRCHRLYQQLGSICLCGAAANVWMFGNGPAGWWHFGFGFLLIGYGPLTKRLAERVANRGLILLLMVFLAVTAWLTGDVGLSAHVISIVIVVGIYETDLRWVRGLSWGALLLIPAFAISSGSTLTADAAVNPRLLALINVAFAVGAGAFLLREYGRRSQQLFACRKEALCELEESVELLRDANAEIEAQLLANRLARRSLERSVTSAHVARAQLVASNEQLEQFAYAASHDLKEPVRTIRSFTQMARRRLPAPLRDDVELTERFDFVEGSALSMHTLLERLLLYSRSGRTPGATQPIDLRRACQQAVVGAGCGAELTRALVAELASAPPVTVVADPAALQVALREVLGNAVAFVAPGAAPEVSIAIAADATHATCRIVDRGIGIEPAYLEQVFGLFKRLHARETYPGAGIGLTLARRALEPLGGSVSLAGHPGGGTVATVTLPIDGPG